MPNIGKYMINVLEGRSNGRDLDKAFGWKTQADIEAERRTSTETVILNNSDIGSGSKL